MSTWVALERKPPPLVDLPGAEHDCQVWSPVEERAAIEGHVLAALANVGVAHPALRSYSVPAAGDEGVGPRQERREVPWQLPPPVVAPGAKNPEPMLTIRTDRIAEPNGVSAGSVSPCLASSAETCVGDGALEGTTTEFRVSPPFDLTVDTAATAVVVPSTSTSSSAPFRAPTNTILLAGG
eukprot:CAMPEP_0117654678 /NCGR_PEP_ID=MMETSP0804-20121206/3874_1 /TAXON_ID=1074897 /ORGANISM="Tetraselmis astigmatica, Strain CCMP880" /LENGTH=180 /DNA_ID=CAMNT_0005460979 /DNA_START=1024 /DNA_END=1568 /DNA_ORIENTATION=+